MVNSDNTLMVSIAGVDTAVGHIVREQIEYMDLSFGTKQLHMSAPKKRWDWVAKWTPEFKAKYCSRFALSECRSSDKDRCMKYAKEHAERRVRIALSQK